MSDSVVKICEENLTENYENMKLSKALPLRLTY